jgi:hypothetical protein
MKAILEYHLPEESDELGRAIFSHDMYSAMWDIQMALRKHYKYDEDPIKVLEEIQELIPTELMEKFWT